MTLDWERLRRGMLIHLASLAGAGLSRFGLGLVLARLLAPAELGLSAMALAIVGVMQVLRDAGLSAWLQQSRELDTPQLRAAAGLSLASSVLAAGALYMASGLLARRFVTPGLEAQLHVLCLGLLLTSYGSLRTSLALRELNAAHIARVSHVGAAAHALASVAFSLLGWGAPGLAWAYVINIAVCNTVHVLRPGTRLALPWRPALRGWREPLRFGLGNMTGALLQTLHSAVPDLLVGLLGTPRLVGLQGRAQGLLGLSAGVFGAALCFGALPELSALHHRGGRVGPLLWRAIGLLAAVSVPLLALTVLCGPVLIVRLYGAAWVEAAPALLPLAVAAELALLLQPLGIALVAIGRPELAAANTGLALLARLVCLPLAFDGTLLSCAWSLAWAALLAAPLQAWLAARHLGLVESTLQPWLRLRSTIRK